MPTEITQNTHPSLLIVKSQRCLEVYSDDLAGRDAFVVDWDNDMQPSGLSAVVDDRGTAHVVPIQAARTSHAGRTVDEARAALKAKRLAPILPKSMGVILAGLRALQLHVEKDDVPLGIAEAYFPDSDYPSVEALDELCARLNLA